MQTKIKGKSAFSIACKLTGDNPKDLDLFSKLPESDYHSAMHQLLILAKGLKIEYSKANKLPKVWEPDYNDSNQRKYETCFWVKADSERPSGFGFSFTLCDLWTTLTTVGSRFAFPTYEMAVFFGEEFEALHLKTKLEIK